MKTRRQLLKSIPVLVGAAILPISGLESTKNKSIYYIDALNPMIYYDSAGKPLYNNSYYIYAYVLTDSNTCGFGTAFPYNTYRSNDPYNFILRILKKASAEYDRVSLQFVFIDSRIKNIISSAEINKIHDLITKEDLSIRAINTINAYKQHRLLS